jgi:hypothetical protein
MPPSPEGREKSEAPTLTLILRKPAQQAVSKEASRTRERTEPSFETALRASSG